MWTHTHRWQTFLLLLTYGSIFLWILSEIWLFPGIILPVWWWLLLPSAPCTLLTLFDHESISLLKSLLMTLFLLFHLYSTHFVTHFHLHKTQFPLPFWLTSISTNLCSPFLTLVSTVNQLLNTAILAPRAWTKYICNVSHHSLLPGHLTSETTCADQLCSFSVCLFAPLFFQLHSSPALQLASIQPEFHGKPLTHSLSLLTDVS